MRSEQGRSPASEWRCPASPGADRASEKLGPEVDAQHEHAVVELPRRVADDREVLEVGLRLLDEAFAIGTGDRRQRTVAHGCGPLAKTRQHGFDVEFVSHRRATLL